VRILPGILATLIHVRRTEMNMTSQRLADLKASLGTLWVAVMAACAQSMRPRVTPYSIEGILLSGLKA
jgi:hypothetical protein